MADDTTMDDEFLRTIFQGPDKLNAWYAEHPQAVTKERAERVSGTARQAMMQGQFETASVLWMVAAGLWMRLQDAERMSRAHLQYLETNYMLASTPEAYAQVRALAHHFSDGLRKAQNRQLAAASDVIAADCAFWASEGTQDEAGAIELRVACLEDLQRAGNDADVIEGGHLERYASLATAIFQTATKTNWGRSQDHAEELLVDLAAATERLVPVEYSFSDAEKTMHVATWLATLSDEYGNPDVAARRRSFAIR